MRLTVITYGAAISAAEIRAGKLEGMLGILLAVADRVWQI